MTIETGEFDNCRRSWGADLESYYQGSLQVDLNFSSRRLSADDRLDRVMETDPVIGYRGIFLRILQR